MCRYVYGSSPWSNWCTSKNKTRWIRPPHSMNKTTPKGIDGTFKELFSRNKNLWSRGIKFSDECVYDRRFDSAGIVDPVDNAELIASNCNSRDPRRLGRAQEAGVWGLVQEPGAGAAAAGVRLLRPVRGEAARRGTPPTSGSRHLFENWATFPATPTNVH